MSDKKALDLFEIPPSLPHPKLPGVIWQRRQQGTICCKQVAEIGWTVPTRLLNVTQNVSFQNRAI